MQARIFARTLNILAKSYYDSTLFCIAGITNKMLSTFLKPKTPEVNQEKLVDKLYVKQCLICVSFISGCCPAQTSD